MAELLLLNGADPLFTSDHGICALDEAKDSAMEKLLRKYIPKHKKSGKIEHSVVVFYHVDKVIETEFRTVETELVSSRSFEKIDSVMSLFHPLNKTHYLCAVVHKKRTLKERERPCFSSSCGIANS